MNRLLILPLGVAALTAAAPVPKHLMPRDQPVPFPTEVGATWVYNVDGREHTRVITASKAQDGTTLVTSEWRESGGNKLSGMVWSVSDKGVFSVSQDETTYDPPWCVFKYPYREGQGWATNVRANATEYTATRTAGPTERIKVPAGEFDAVRVEWEGTLIGSTAPRATAWYAPGVGQVRFVFRDRVGKETYVVELKSFTPGRSLSTGPVTGE